MGGRRREPPQRRRPRAAAPSGPAARSARARSPPPGRGRRAAGSGRCRRRTPAGRPRRTAGGRRCAGRRWLRPSSAASPGPAGRWAKSSGRPGQERVDRGPPALLERREPLGRRHRERHPARPAARAGPPCTSICAPAAARQRRPDHPPAVLGVLDERHVELVPRRGHRRPRRWPGRAPARRHWRGRREQGGCGSPAHRMTSARPRVTGVSSCPETLHDLSLAHGTLDRAALRRKDPELPAKLLASPDDPGARAA